MKKMSFSLATATFLLLFLSQACQKPSDAEVAPAEYTVNFVAAKTNSELAALMSNPDANVIRNMNQLNALVASGKTPLSKLSEKDLHFFKENLVPGEKGFGSMHVGVLKTNLSETDYVRVMYLFGLDTKNGFWGNANSSEISKKRFRSSGDEDELPGGDTDYRFRRCDGSHNCIATTADIICTSNC